MVSLTIRQQFFLRKIQYEILSYRILHWIFLKKMCEIL